MVSIFTVQMVLLHHGKTRNNINISPKPFESPSVKINIMRLLSLLLCLLSFTVSAKNYGSTMVKEITSIYDADTFRVNIEGYPPILVNESLCVF